MKKFIALAIAVVMLAALAVPAFATDYESTAGDATGSTVVTYGVGSSYILVVPATVAVGSSDTFGVKEVNILATEEITVEIATEGELVDVTDEENVFEGAFSIKVNNDADTASVTYTDDDTNDTIAIIAGTLPQDAGSYTGAITFTASIGTATNS